MIARFFTKTFTLKRASWYEESGEMESGVSFKGHLQQASPELIKNLDLSLTVAYRIWCPITTDLERGDIVTTGGTDYIVRAITSRDYGVNQHKEAIAEEVQEEE